MADIVRYELSGKVAVITIDNPPVNAMSHAARQGVWEAMERLAADTKAEAAVLICAGRTFSAGADIAEFDQPAQDPWLPAVVHKIEASPKVVVAAIHGTALGGGLEIALGCHYRCAVPSAQIGLPEVNLGLLPGAGGTQRLPRLVGVRKALDMMISGKPISASEARACGAIDEIVEGELAPGATAYAQRLTENGAPVRRLSERQVDKSGIGADFFAEYRGRMVRSTRGFFAPEQIVKCAEAALTLPYREALKQERELFEACRRSTQSGALRHLFFAEREAAKVPDVPKGTPAREIRNVAVLGAGTMGGGIAMNFAGAGFPVTVLEANREALDRGLNAVRRNYQSAVDRGRMSLVDLDHALNLIKGSLDYTDLAGSDLVIEAVFENLGIKKQLFAKLDEICKPGAILASNTSTLDLNDIAAATGRPQDVIGMHFFAPAHVMKLLELVRCQKTAREVIATAMAIAKRIGKVGVLVGVCFGFVGNRMFLPYRREAQRMILEGVPPERIDRVACEWGMAMGPNAVSDLSGIDVFFRLLNEWKERPDDPAFFRMSLALHDLGRLGQKSGAGFYRYEGRDPVPDPEVMEIARKEAAALGIESRDIDDQEIIERLFFPMINEGALILEEGIALRPGDIDVIFANGYGFPRYRGGPMFYADSVGPKMIRDVICRYRDRYGGRYWTPAPLLEKLAQEAKTFAEWSGRP